MLSNHMEGWLSVKAKSQLCYEVTQFTYVYNNICISYIANYYSTKLFIILPYGHSYKIQTYQALTSKVCANVIMR